MAKTTQAAHDDRAAQGGARRRPLRRPGGEELPRSTRSRTGPGGAAGAPRTPSRSASPPSTTQLARRVGRSSGSSSSQERMDLADASSRRWAPRSTSSALEADFVKTAAKATPQRKGISYAAWRELGVPADVLKKAGISRGCLSSRRRRGADAAAASSDRSSTTPSAQPRSGVAGALGVRHEPHHVAGLVADAGDVVEAAVGVVDVAEHDAVVVAQRARASSASHT